ncbi:ARAID factor, partial [Turnix velox]|nr:ARAID factor [Turnix velox]
LDLSNCSLHSLPAEMAEATTAIVLDLTENPLSDLPSDTFLGFTLLQQLMVPQSLQCPGGREAWQEERIHGSHRLCQGQENPCNGSTGPGMEELGGAVGQGVTPDPFDPVTPLQFVSPVLLCPENAACAPAGPGLTQCLCHSPFHGYKCLREGTFPILLFCGALGTLTLALSLLLWGTQRRKAKTS